MVYSVFQYFPRSEIIPVGSAASHGGRLYGYQGLRTIYATIALLAVTQVTASITLPTVCVCAMVFFYVANEIQCLESLKCKKFSFVAPCYLLTRRLRAFVQDFPSTQGHSPAT